MVTVRAIYSSYLVNTGPLSMPSHSRLCLVLGDQLSFDLANLQGFDRERDAVLMVEVLQEATHVPHGSPPIFNRHTW